LRLQTRAVLVAEVLIKNNIKSLRFSDTKEPVLNVQLPKNTARLPSLLLTFLSDTISLAPVGLQSKKFSTIFHKIHM
jgi:hypothetical protein